MTALPRVVFRESSTCGRIWPELIAFSGVVGLVNKVQSLASPRESAYMRACRCTVMPEQGMLQGRKFRPFMYLGHRPIANPKTGGDNRTARKNIRKGN